MTKKEEILCKICKQPINKSIDSYVHVEDFYKGKFYGDGYYHNSCYLERLKSNSDKETSALKKMCFDLVGRTNKLLDEQGVENPSKEFDIVPK